MNGTCSLEQYELREEIFRRYGEDAWCECLPLTIPELYEYMDELEAA